MTGRPAARLADHHVCPATTANVPHVGGPILGPGSTKGRDVFAEGFPVACAGDRASCIGPPDFIVTGAAQVLVGGKPAARRGDHLMHGGVLQPPLAKTVLIGGPTVGVTLGNIQVAVDACIRAARGRTSRSTKQSHPNCGVEAVRQIINHTVRRDAPVSENGLLLDAMMNNEVQVEPVDIGGTNAPQRIRILTRYGVGARRVEQTMENAAQAAAEGRGVVSGHNFGKLYGFKSNGGHIILVAGVVYGADGKIVKMIVNDTSSRAEPQNCAAEVTAQRFKDSLFKSNNLIVTTSPIW